LSGGLDSAVALAICQSEGYAAHALTIDYGQRHHWEIEAARRVAQAAGVKRHIVLNVDLTAWGGSALTQDLTVPTHRNADAMGQGIPITYVPGRNTIFLSLAMAWAETLETGHLFIGAHALDYSGYPDCRPDYFHAYEQMANLATKSGVEGNAGWQIHTPLIDMTKADIIRRGEALGVPFALTVSCYQPREDKLDFPPLACGICDSCIIRRRAFDAAGVDDPIEYAIAPE
ncbi:MAG: 7-cyano-7-deazaguanine synthase QueC, partial [candidate division Zixibacteria bacterium]|nr:7-cyano-7-deazaguanine synthase QueC [candidate division Zixibacteria bacterium]